jgi:hypothetical protein
MGAWIAVFCFPRYTPLRSACSGSTSYAALLAKCSRHRLVNLQRKARFNIGHRVPN